MDEVATGTGKAQELESDVLKNKILEGAAAGESEGGTAEPGKETLDAGRSGEVKKEEPPLAAVDVEPTAEELKEVPPEVGKDRKAQLAFIKLRRENKKLAEGKESKERKAESERTETLDAGRSGKTAEQKPGESGGEGDPERLAKNRRVFTILAGANGALRGDIVEGIESPEHAKELKRLATDVIRLMAPAEILEIIAEAEKDGFAGQSAAIRAIAAEQLPIAQARGEEDRKKLEAEHAKFARHNQTIAEGVQAAYAKYPELKQSEPGKESEEFKFVSEWIKTKVGTPDKPGLLFAAVSAQPEKIGDVFDLAMDTYKAQKFNALKTERDELNARLQSLRNPESGGHPIDEGGKPSLKSEELKRQILEGVGAE